MCKRLKTVWFHPFVPPFRSGISWHFCRFSTGILLVGHAKTLVDICWRNVQVVRWVYINTFQWNPNDSTWFSWLQVDNRLWVSHLFFIKTWKRIGLPMENTDFTLVQLWGKDPMRQKDTSTRNRGQKRREWGKKITQCVLWADVTLLGGVWHSNHATRLDPGWTAPLQY